MFVVAGVVFLGYAAVLWAFVRGEHPFRDRAWANGLAFAGFWILAAWLVVSTRASTGTVQEGNVTGAFGTMGALFVLIVGILLAIPFWMHLAGLFTEGGIRSVLGIERMKVDKSWDVADKAEHERRYDDAIKLYLLGAAESPADPEPFRRAGEAAIKKGAIEEGVDYLRRALARTTPPEDVASLAFRIAEVLDRTLQKRTEARQVLELSAQKLAGTRFEQYARERLRQMT